MLKSPLLLKGTSTSSSSSLTSSEVAQEFVEGSVECEAVFGKKTEPDEAHRVEEAAAKEKDDQEVVEEQGAEKPQFDGFCGFDCTDDEFKNLVAAAEAEAEIKAQVKTLGVSAEKASSFAQKLRKVSEDAHKTFEDTHKTYWNVHYLAVEATKAEKCAKDQLWAGQKKLKVIDEAVRFAAAKK